MIPLEESIKLFRTYFPEQQTLTSTIVFCAVKKDGINAILSCYITKNHFATGLQNLKDDCLKKGYDFLFFITRENIEEIRKLMMSNPMKDKELIDKTLNDIKCYTYE